VKFLDKLLDKIADKAADKVVAKLKEDRPAQIGFHTVEAQDLHEAQFHHTPKELE
jgi:hypothetical protein